MDALLSTLRLRAHRLRPRRRAGLVSLLFLFFGAAALAPASGQNVRVEDQKLLPSGSSADDQAGRRVAISGDFAAVGIPLDDHSGLSDTGSVYLYRRSAGSWGLVDRISEPTVVGGNRFGWSVEMDGPRVIVTSIPNASVFGSAYIYRISGSTLLLEATLGVGENGGYGYSADISGDIAIVGRYVASSVGLASIYRYTAAAGWRIEQIVRAPDGAANDWFGLAVAIEQGSSHGEAAMVGSQHHASDRGAAYLFRRTAQGSWSVEQKLMASDGVPGDQFGISLDLTVDRAIVSAWPKDDGLNDSGAAYGHRFDGTSWIEEKLVPSNLRANGYFGTGVSADGDRLVCGAYGETQGGALFVFRDCGGSFVEQHQLRVSDPGSKLLGWDTAVDGTSVLGGAPFDDETAPHAGAVYAYELNPFSLSSPPWQVTIGDPLSIVACGGPPSSLGFLIVTHIDASPSFTILLTTAFDSVGHWELSTTVPNLPGLAGHRLGFTSMALVPNVGLVQSNETNVDFQ